MKTLKFLSALIIGLLVIAGCNNNISQSRAVDVTTVAVFYTSDDANSTLAAAEVAIRYPMTTLFDIDNVDSAGLVTQIQAIDSVHRIFILVDTATKFVDNKFGGAHYDSVVIRLYNDTTDGIPPTALPDYFTSTATKNVAELVQDALLPNTTHPLITNYLSDDAWALRSNQATKYNNSDSTIVDSTGSLVADAYIGDWVYIYSGTGMGQYRKIYDNDTDTLYVSPDWETNPDSTSLFKIKDANENNELFYDQYATYYILTYLTDFTADGVFDAWKKLLDNNGMVAGGYLGGTPKQDVNFLRNTVLDKGKAIFDYAVHVEDD